MLKKFTRWLCGCVLVASIPLFIILTTIVTLARPAQISQWVETSGAYNSLPDTVLEEVSKKQETSGESSSINFADPGVKTAAKEALSPEFLKSSTEDFLNGTYKWLDGEVDKPDFSIDVLSAKQTFAQRLSDYAKQRYTELPACAAGALPKSTDPLKIDCQPRFGFDIDQLAEIFKVDLISNPDFLPEPLITADTLEKGNTSGEPIFSNTAIPTGYQWLRRTPLIFGALILLSSLGLLLLRDTKREGLSRIAKRFVSMGILSGLILAASYYGLGQLRDKFDSQTDPTAPAYALKEVVFSTLNAVRADTLKTGGMLAGAFIVTGAVLLLALRIFKPKLPEDPNLKPEVSKKDKPTNNKDAQKQETTKAKPVPSAPIVKPKQQSTKVVTPSGPPNKTKPPLIQ